MRARQHGTRPARVLGAGGCNSFHENCEKLFRLDLAARPVVVFSYNDIMAIDAVPWAIRQKQHSQRYTPRRDKLPGAACR
jgi:hypothetical protein